jgi:hypothetical protein
MNSSLPLVEMGSLPPHHVDWSFAPLRTRSPISHDVTPATAKARRGCKSVADAVSELVKLHDKNPCDAAVLFRLAKLVKRIALARPGTMKVRVYTSHDLLALAMQYAPEEKRLYRYVAATLNPNEVFRMASGSLLRASDLETMCA